MSHVAETEKSHSYGPRWGLLTARNALLLMVVIWAVVLASYAIARYMRLNATTYDLAIKSQVIWNTYQGRLFASSIEVEHYLGDHVQPIMLLLAPFFALWEDTRILMILQALLLSLGAVPVYRIARRAFAGSGGPGGAGLPLAFAAAYLLYPTIGFVNRFDFHPLTFVIFFLLAAYDQLEVDRPVRASLLMLLALLCREDVGFTVFALGLYVAVRMRRPRLGFSWAAAGLVWSLSTIFLVIPAFRGEASDTLARYGWLGNGPLEMATAALTQPALVLEHIFGVPFRRQFLFKLFLPLGFLPLLAPEILIVAVPALTYNLLSETPSQSSIYFQYISPVVPFLFIAALQGASRLRRWLRRRAIARHSATAAIALTLTLGVAAAWIIENPFTSRIDEPYWPVYGLQRFNNADAFHEARAKLPATASVATMQNYGPYLALRQELYLFHDILRRREWQYGFPKSEYALLNLTDLRWGVNARLFYATIETAIGYYGYEALYFSDDVLLLHRDSTPQPATGAALQRTTELLEAGGKFAPAAPETLDWMGRQWLREALPESATVRSVVLDEAVHLLGYELSENPVAPNRPFCATLYWRTDDSLSKDYTVFFHLTGLDGFVLAQRDRTPAQGFYPTSKWREGEVVADMHCLRIPAGLAEGTYHLNAGLYDPASGQRLPILDDEQTSPHSGAVHLTPVQVGSASSS